MTTKRQNHKRQKVALLQLPAGLDPSGNPVLEQVEVYILDTPDHYELKQSPLFIRNLARGDVFHVNEDDPTRITPVQRSGMLAIRVFRREDIDLVAAQASPEVEKLGGSLDIKTPRGLSYSLPVSNGFAAIETLFDGVMADFPDTVWYYGNIYDPEDGSSPLNWWGSFLNPA